jgi:P27 family predicted phage terminase small subunit
MDFLTDSGRKIYKRLEKHCKETMKMLDIDSLEMSMLANSMALYFEMAEFLKDNQVKMTFVTEKGTYEQIRPEYTVMKNEYQNILKHGAKFGLNPGDREKIFKGLKKEKEKKGFTLN